MKIALCDDEKPFLLWFKKKLEKHVPAVQADEFIIDLYSDGRSLLKAQAKQKYNVIFLDIHMPGIDGMAVARQLWQQSGEPIIIFTSEKEELVFQALRVHPFEFLKKSEIDRELPRLLRDILCELRRNGEMLTLKCRQPPGYGIYTRAGRLLSGKQKKRHCRLYQRKGIYHTGQPVGKRERTYPVWIYSHAFWISCK